jgi:CheY-like chemotaxis protein
MKHKVLVVDDDHVVADTLRMILVINGFDTEACYSAAEGLQLARTFAPQLLLCDVSMPDEDGFHLAAAVHREMPTCQMIMLTAFLTSSATLELEALRMQHPVTLLNKPCPPELLLREVDHCLSIERWSRAS